jgi:hypothetical protein
MDGFGIGGIADNVYSQPDMPPFRSARTGHMFRRDELPWRRPEVVQDARARVFDLAVEDDLAAFVRVLQKAGMNPPAARLHLMEKQYCEGTGSWKVFLIWYDLFSELPDEARARRDAFLRGETCL